MPLDSIYNQTLSMDCEKSTVYTPPWLAMIPQPTSATPPAVHSVVTMSSQPRSSARGP